MILYPKCILLVLAFSLVLAIGATTSAQTRTRTPTTRKPPAARTAKPAPAKPKPAAPAPKPAAPKPAATPPKAAEPVGPPPAPAKEEPKPDANAPADDLGIKLEKDPAVLTALEMPRKKPADYLQAVLWLIDLDRQKFAKPILEELAKQQLTDAQRAELVELFGSSSMLKLARAQELAPTGASFAEACMAAASAITNNPQRINTLVKQLADPSPEVRALAQHDLAASGQKAATATLEAMARETDPNRRAAFASGAAAIHPLVDGPLLAMLDTRDPALRADVADMLQQLKVPQAAPLLAANDLTAEHQLSAALTSYVHGTPVFAADQSNQVELWQWNDATKQLSAVRLPANEARIAWMSKLARILSQMRPQNPDYQRRALVLAWESDSLNSAKPSASANAQTQMTDTRLLNDVLADALKENYPHAAVAAANALAQRGDRSVLLTSDGKPSPLAEAIVSPNRSVRFAALSAIMALDPPSPYPGSSRIPDALAWFAADTAERRALVAMPTHAAASDLAGLLMAQNLGAEATNRGRDLIAMARDMPDLEAIFVDMDIQVPGIREVLFELRANPTTGEVPIALLAADGRLEAAQKLAAEHQRVIAVPRPHSPEVVTNAVKALTELAGANSVPANERAAQAAQAKAWLARLESGSRPFYVVRRTALLNFAPPRQDRPNLPK